MKRSRIKSRGKKTAARIKAQQQFRAAVLVRCRGYCDRCQLWFGDQLHAHHYRPKGLGGSDDPRLPWRIGLLSMKYRNPNDIHEDGNGVGLCTSCHLHTHLRHTDKYGNASVYIDSRNRSLLGELPESSQLPMTGDPACSPTKKSTASPPTSSRTAAPDEKSAEPGGSNPV